MKSTLRFAALAVVLTWFGGCGGGETPTASAPSGDAPAATGSSAAPVGESAPATAAAAPAARVDLPVSAQSPPNEVVLAFLNAMRDGNSGVAGALLTDQAQAETTKHEWPIQPPGAPTATYQLGEPSFANPEATISHVACLWTEPDGSGSQVQFAVTWALRKLDQGWRVAGFATEVVPGKPHYYFDFEDIANLKETQAMAEAALAEASGTTETPAAEAAPTAEATAAGSPAAAAAPAGAPAAEVAGRPEAGKTRR